MSHFISRSDLDASDALVFRVLKKRAEAIEDALGDDPAASLSATDLGVLKELRKVAGELREARDRAAQAQEQAQEHDPQAEALGAALLAGEFSQCMKLIGQAIEAGRAEPCVDGARLAEILAERKGMAKAPG